jgi:hypothetical protein
MDKCIQCGKTMGGFDSIGLLCSQCKTNNDLRDSVKGRGGNSNDEWIPVLPLMFFFSLVKYSNRLLTYFEIGVNEYISIGGILFLIIMFPLSVILYYSIKHFLEELFQGGEYLLYVFVLYLTYDLIKPWL